jgi:GH18 family chitinase
MRNSITSLIVLATTSAVAVAEAPLVTFTVTSSWDDGYNGSITIANRDQTAIDGWLLEYDGGPEISSLWNGSYTTNGQTTSITDAGWNGLIGPGASVQVGFGADGTLQENVTNCTLNGVVCDVAYEGVGGGDGGDDGGDDPGKNPTTLPGPFDCTGDLDNSGSVGVTDLLALLNAWGEEGPADFDADGIVSTTDLLQLMSVWGDCPPQRRIVAYFIEWGIYGRDYQPLDTPAGKITHINYAFANIGADLRIAIGDPYAAIDKYYDGDTSEQPYRGTYNQLNNVLKAKYPHLKVLISVGGWTWSGRFSDAALTPQSRAVFAESCVDFIRAYNFDGVDLDWEYPVCCGLPGNTYRPEDKENYTLLLQELRTQLDAAAAQDGRTYLLTIASPGGYDKLENMDLAGIAEACDWINLMGYDYHGAWDLTATNHHSKLYPNPDDPGDPLIAQRYNTDWAVQVHFDAGVSPEKLVVGVPFYGRAWMGVPPDNDGLFQSATGVPPGTWDDGTSGATGINDYTEIESFMKSGLYQLHRDPDSLVPWLYSPTAHNGHFISFEDPASIAAKAEYAVQRNVGGLMFWEITADRNERLLDEVVTGLGGRLPAGR